MSSDPIRAHEEIHYVDRVGWLRAAVLGANDGIISTAALLTGVAAAGADKTTLLVTGMAGLVAGAVSMAAGEYVSVSSQKDLEQADIAREKDHIENNPDEELEELAAIYEARGLSADLAVQVAKALSEKDALQAHIRDELGLDEDHQANPVVAALSSAVTFAGAALLPLMAAYFAPSEHTALWLLISTLLSLALLGALGAKAGGAPMLRAVVRVVILGALALLLAHGIGQLFGISV